MTSEPFDPKDYDDSASQFFQLPPLVIKGTMMPQSLTKMKQQAFYGDALLNMFVTAFFHDEIISNNTLSLESAARIRNYFISDDNLALILKAFFTGDVQISPFWNNQTMASILKAYIYLSDKQNGRPFIQDRIRSLLIAIFSSQNIKQIQDEIAICGTCADALQQVYITLTSALEMLPNVDWNSYHKPANIVQVMWRSRSRKEYFQHYYACCGKTTDEYPRNTIIPGDHECNRYSWDSQFSCHIGKLMNATSRSQGGGGVGSILQGKEAHWSCCEEDAHTPGCVSWHKFKKMCQKKPLAVWQAEQAQQAVILCQVLQTAPPMTVFHNDVPLINLKYLNLDD